MRSRLVVLLAALVSCPLVGAADVLPSYAPPASDVAGELRVVGSDTMSDLVASWVEAFEARHPGVEIELRSRGSGTGPPALVASEAHLAPMSRRMTADEIRAFREAHGVAPVFVRVALDALAVYVHRDNPLRGITLDQLDGIFSRTRRCGGRPVHRWGQLVYGSLAERPIRPFGRNELSGTHDFFRDTALCGGEFRAEVEELPSSIDVVRAVADDVTAIGYAGIGFRSAAVRPLAISARDEEGPFYAYVVDRHRSDPDLRRRYAYVFEGRYPLSRDLYVYLSPPGDEGYPAALEAFLRFVFSREGQDVVHESGFIPLTSTLVEPQLEKLAPGWRAGFWTSE